MEKRLAQLIKTLALCELEVASNYEYKLYNNLQCDRIRYFLSRNSEFTYKAAFKYIDRHDLGHIRKEDLKDFLYDEKIDCSNDEVTDLIHTNDTTLTGCVDYVDFVGMLEPRTYTFLHKQEENSDELTRDPRSLLREFFEKEIYLLRRIDPIVRELRYAVDYKSHDLFRLLDRKMTRSFNYEDLDKFMEDQGVLLTNPELVAIFRRADRRNNGRITYLEFKKFVLFRMSSLIDLADDPLEPRDSGSAQTQQERSHVRLPNPKDFKNSLYPNTFDSAYPTYNRTTNYSYFASDNGNLTIKSSTDQFSQYKKKEMALTGSMYGQRPGDTFSREHFEHFESKKPSDFYYYRQYYPYGTFKNYSHTLQEFPKLERDYTVPTHHFTSSTKIAEISKMQPLKATSYQFDIDEKKHYDKGRSFNPAQPMPLSKMMERWEVKTLADADSSAKLASLEAPKTGGIIRRAADIVVNKPSYL